MLPRVIHERIPLREWLGHMSLFHANVQIRNDSARTLYITMIVVTVVDEEEESLPAYRRGAALAPGDAVSVALGEGGFDARVVSAGQSKSVSDAGEH
jgi:hypothetical protein